MQIKSVSIKFRKLLHETDKAILVRLMNNKEHWIPKKLCRKLVVNKKLGGNVHIPAFFYKKMGYKATDDIADISIVHHVPKKINQKASHDTSLFK